MEQRGEVGPVSQSQLVKALLGCETLRVWTRKARKSRAALLKWEGLPEVFKGNVSGLQAGETPLRLEASGEALICPWMGPLGGAPACHLQVLVTNGAPLLFPLLQRRVREATGTSPPPWVLCVHQLWHQPETEGPFLRGGSDLLWKACPGAGHSTRGLWCDHGVPQVSGQLCAQRCSPRSLCWILSSESSGLSLLLTSHLLWFCRCSFSITSPFANDSRWLCDACFYN